MLIGMNGEAIRRWRANSRREGPIQAGAALSNLIVGGRAS
jgi:hypothetical protein